ncbi:MAG: hypothetical protein ACE5J2_07730 [Nitrososphaerales archaeon]
MKHIHIVAVAVLAMVVVISPAYGATESPNDATTIEIREFFGGIVQFFQNIISALVQAINNQLPAS